jgi:hydrogenase expression/formation protein HypD
LKYLDEYRNPRLASKMLERIAKKTSRRWTIMEICGGQTHTIIRSGIDRLLPDRITILHGPGCPVCVTPVHIVDKALKLASRPNLIFCTFGDMMRVPGSTADLLSVKANGGDIRIVYSPLDAVQIARENPQKEIVFFAVGFETTAPANGMAVLQAYEENLDNFSLLVSQVLVPPAIEAILSAPENRVNGFLAAGHVCTVMGYHEYMHLAEKFRVPIVVTGFEPLDILQGIEMLIAQLEKGTCRVENQYRRAVTEDGNLHAQRLLSELFDVTDRVWRGIGKIPRSGLTLKEKYRRFDAEVRFGLGDGVVSESLECVSGFILQGVRNPFDCPAFGIRCTPEKPLGATMVSSEGACAAYYRYRAKTLESTG